MRITFIFTSFPRKPIGGCRVIYQYANHLADRGHTVNLVYPKILDNSAVPPNLWKMIRREAGQVYKKIFHPKPRWHFIDPRVNSFYVPNLNPKNIPDADFIFATFWIIAKYMEEHYPSRKGKKSYLFQHYEIWGGDKEAVDSTWKSSFLKVAVSKWLYETGNSLGAENMAYIPNGLDFNLFKMTNPIESRSFCVSMAYSDIPWKGSKDGILALKLIRERLPEVKVILFGPTKPGLELPSWIEYYTNPSQEKIAQIYNKSSVFICPSHTEGFGLPPAEAMAAGCAVASTDCGGVRDFAEDQKTALLSAPRDYSALADNAIKLLEDKELRFRIANSGKEKISGFTWDKSVDLLEEFLKRNYA